MQYKTGNDFEDVMAFEEQLNIEIQVYNFESRQRQRKSDQNLHFDV